MEVHNILPVYNNDSKVLILGSFPSVKSRETGFFYGHPQNRFWKMLAGVLEQENVPETIPDKKDMLLKSRIAVWDVIASCDITGSSDTTIRNVVPNDISVILGKADIKTIICNGAKSYELYNKYLRPLTGRDAAKLPSTSPANAAVSLEKLIELWKDVILKSI